MTNNAIFTPLAVTDYKQHFKDERSGHFLLDVRTIEEFEEVRIPGAVNIPLADLPQRVSEVPGDQPIVVVCRTGMRSMMGAQILRQSGLKDIEIYNLEGGTQAWVRHGWTYEQGK